MTLICGCRGWTHDSAAQDFLRSSSTLQQLTLRQFPHKEQIELYLEAMHRGHPPNIGLAHSLAKNGASILPFLIERLARTDNDVDKEFLIVVFVAMQLSAYDPVSSDRTLMAFLEHQVSTMKDRDWKEMASESLSESERPAPNDSMKGHIATYAGLGVSELIFDFRSEEPKESLERMERFAEVMAKTKA